MLIDKRCPHCGATMQFENTMESMFCPFCGGMVTNEIYDYQDVPISNEPNLYISFNSTDPSVGMVTRIVSTGVKNTYINGQTLSFHLVQGPQTIVLKIGSRNYNRSIVIPSDNSPVRIYASYNGRAHIAIDQPQEMGTLNNSIKGNSAGSYSDVTTNNPVNSASTSQPGSSNKPIVFGIIGIVVLIAMVRSCFSSFSDSSSYVEREIEDTTTVVTTSAVATYPIELNIECEENLLLDKYDVDVFVDDKKAGKIDHGTSKTISGNISEGKHTIRFCESGYESIDGSCDIDVTGPITINCKIQCSGSQVEILEFETSAIELDPLSGKPVSGRQQRNGFDNSTNTVLKLANYDCEIPNYWNDIEPQNTDGQNKTFVAKNEADNSIVSLICFVIDDPNNEEIKGILKNQEAFAATLAQGFEATKYTLIKQEITRFGDVNGLLTVMDVTFVGNGVEREMRVCIFLFASTEEQKYMMIGILATNDSEYEYTVDFAKTLNSIKKKDD